MTFSSQTPSTGVVPSQSVMQSWSRSLVAAIGVLLLTVPALLLHVTIGHRSDAEWRLATERARTRAQTTLQLWQQDVERLLIDERVATFAAAISEHAHRTGEWPVTPTTLAAATRAALPLLDEAKLSPIAVMLMHQAVPRGEGYYANATTSVPFASVTYTFPLYTEMPTLDAQYFQTLLLEFVNDYFMVSPDADAARLITRLSPTLLGIQQKASHFLDDSRRRVTPVTYHGRPAWFYWTHLPAHDWVDRCATLVPDPTQTFAPPDGGRFYYGLRQRVTPGGIALILPRVTADRGGTAVRHLLAPDIALACREPHRPEAVWQHRPAGAPDLAPLVWGRPTVDAAEWVIATDTLFLEERSTIAAAAQIDASARAVRRQRRSEQHVIHILYLSLASLWLAALFLFGLLDTSLERQLRAGLLLTALLPLAAVFAIGEALTLEWRQTIERDTRARLRQALTQTQHRQTLNHPWYAHGIASESRDPALVQYWDREKARTDRAATRRMEQSLHELFERLREGNYGFSIRSIYVTGPRGFAAGAFRDTEIGSDSHLLGLIMDRFSSESLSQLNPEWTAGAASLSAAEAIRGDIMYTAGLDVARSIFGTFGLFSLIHAPGTPIYAAVGVAPVGMVQILVPATGPPTHSVFWVVFLRYSDRQALYRILHGNDGATGGVYAFERGFVGNHCIPETGERHRWLRSVARRIEATHMAESSRVESDGHTWLVEGMVGLFSNQFIYVAIADEAPLLAAVAHARRSIVLLLLAALLLAMALARATVRELLAPVHRLVEAMGVVERGDYSRRLAIERDDELGDLARQFNEMARGLAEEQLLGRMVSAAARAAIGSRDDEARARAGERRPVTILFVGIPGFADRLADTGAALLLNRLDTQVRVACRLIADHGGDIDKLLGDKILAIFDHQRLGSARSATEGAVAAIDALFAAVSAGALPFPVAAGLNSGTVVAGLLGSGARRDFTVIGDPVNLAARAESIAEKLPDGHWAVCTAAAAQLMPHRTLRELPQTRVKGKTEAVQLFSIAPKR